MHLSKMAPTPALCALSRCSSEAKRTPSFRPMERWENEAMRSSFQPERRGTIKPSGGNISQNMSAVLKVTLRPQRKAVSKEEVFDLQNSLPWLKSELIRIPVAILKCILLCIN